MSTIQADPNHEHVDKDGFRLRGIGLARIDAFSDVVFGFALTLLVVSLEVPKTFDDLHSSLRAFVPFAISFLLLMLIWFAHYKYFRRFGTHDVGTITINAILLFVILFYVYPLKFLFTVVAYGFMGIDTNYFNSMHQVVELMELYGCGFTAIYLLLVGLYANAYRQRVALGLSVIEKELTRGYMAELAGVASIGMLACVLVAFVPERFAGYTGWTYMLIAPVSTLLGVRTGKRIKALKRNGTDAQQA